MKGKGMAHAWTPDMLRRLRELHAVVPELAFPVISAILSAEFHLQLTTNACIGKSHRLRLPQRIAGFQRRAKPMVRKRVDASIEVPIPQPAAEPFSTSIYQLRAGVCHWPQGDNPPFAYCGLRTYEDKPYCDEHCAMAYAHSYR